MLLLWLDACAMPTLSSLVSVSEVQATQFWGMQLFKAEVKCHLYSVPSPELSSVHLPLRTQTPALFLFRPSSDMHLDNCELSIFDVSLSTQSRTTTLSADSLPKVTVEDGNRTNTAHLSKDSLEDSRSSGFLTVSSEESVLSMDSTWSDTVSANITLGNAMLFIQNAIWWCEEVKTMVKGDIDRIYEILKVSELMISTYCRRKLTLIYRCGF